MDKDTLVLAFIAGDIGGTNTNLALVTHAKGRFSILHSARYSTQEEKSLIDPMGRFLKEIKEQGYDFPIASCCISAAGLVKNRRIQLTNAPWSIDAQALENTFRFSVHLINDFTAISYGVVIIDQTDKEQIFPLPHLSGKITYPGLGMALVIGAGTGLGTGFIHKKIDGSYEAFPSEGGHSEFSCSNDLQFAFQKWLTAKIGMVPGIELAASGQGIGNIFAYLCSSEFSLETAKEYPTVFPLLNAKPDPLAHSIMQSPEQERPALIAANTTKDPRCLLAMELFTEFYARKVSSLCSVFLPTGGIYLAGGITAKNISFLMEDNRFMKTFEKNYAPHIRDFLSTAPVMLVKNYSISLIGAANAAYQFVRS